MNSLSTRATLHPPDHWTPQQALAIYELLNDLAESIWSQYEIPLLELLAPELQHHDDSQPEPPDFDNLIPF